MKHSSLEQLDKDKLDMFGLFHYSRNESCEHVTNIPQISVEKFVYLAKRQRFLHRVIDINGIPVFLLGIPSFFFSLFTLAPFILRRFLSSRLAVKFPWKIHVHNTIIFSPFFSTFLPPSRLVCFYHFVIVILFSAISFTIP